jgi:outer membrane protein assembly factor BamD
MAALLAAALLAGCSGGGASVREKSAQEWYDEGATLAAKKKYDEALEAFRQASGGYRGAALDADIQIALADTYFLKEEYPAAVEAYGEFLRLHPHNTRADYAQYRIGLCWQKQMRRADRSQDAARKAAAAFEALLRGYPRSPLLEAGREGLTAARRRIAEHELSVADFYRRTGADRAAAGRYEVVLRDYADLGFTDRALFDLANCYRRLGDEEKAARLFELLRRDFPQSRFIKEIKSARG